MKYAMYDMQIANLVMNKTFEFNVHYRIYKYLGEDEMLLRFDSEKDNEIPWDVKFQTITAINMSDDGVVEIEYCE